MDKNKRKVKLRTRRHRRVRRRVVGSAERPRMCVFRSNRHIYAQVVDDAAGHTLVSCSSLSPELRESIPHGGAIEAARLVGELIGKKCVEKGIGIVAFDRGGYRFHGRVKALALAARQQFEEAGLKGF